MENPILDAWRSALQRWETETNKLLNQATASDESAKAMNGLLSGAVQVQAAFAETMAKTLSALNLPSREDITRLSEQIGEVERKVDLLLNSRNATAETSVPAPARTRRPPMRDASGG